MIRISLNKGLDYVFEKGISWGESKETEFGRIPRYISTTYVMAIVGFLQESINLKK